ncbi:hypothetical protein [Helicobacter sp. MIT 01-3238]|uniref:hypothetical protein n=1 Tax=Helicobacter sp. MIT 01-3238 TaxID=398627 RepID=UPI000E3AE7A9|nr:hypothetical protein [Helicobacter sp. MIT 01-3238]RDU53601.1 hypothetical protein CQA40_04730 [Helicobacter sp. MIT 01-3238]
MRFCGYKSLVFLSMISVFASGIALADNTNNTTANRDSGGGGRFLRPNMIPKCKIQTLPTQSHKNQQNHKTYRQKI